MWSEEERKEEEAPIGYRKSQNDTVDPFPHQSETHVQANPGGLSQSSDWLLAFQKCAKTQTPLIHAQIRAKEKPRVTGFQS